MLQSCLKDSRTEMRSAGRTSCRDSDRDASFATSTTHTHSHSAPLSPATLPYTWILYTYCDEQSWSLLLSPIEDPRVLLYGIPCQISLAGIRIVR